MTLSVRLAVVMVGLVLITATSVGLLTYYTVTTAFAYTELAAVLGVIVLAFLVGYSMVLPLIRIVRAAAVFPCIDLASLPTSARGEIGTVVRAFARIAAETRAKTEAYEREIERSGRAETLSRQMLRQAVEACPNGMVMIDGAGKIVMVNTGTERLFGYPRNELIGQSADVIMPERLRARNAQYRAEFVRHPESHKAAGLDLFGRRKDGSEFPVAVSLNPVNSGDGLLILGVIIDLSERERADRLKDEFVSTVSHELRTPLTSISGALGLLVGKAAGTLPDAVVRLLTIAHTNSQRLVRLVNDILDIEKLESGQIAFDLKRVEVRSIVEQAIDANRGFADTYKVMVQLDPASANVEARADPDRLIQVVTNLLSNAIKFSPLGGIVVVATGKRDDVVRISVRDHGPGVPAGFKSRIFEKFAQADKSDTRQKGGTGLGLSIVKAITERLGGSVGFDDAPGGGTIFYVEIPDWKHGFDSDIDPETILARILLCEHEPKLAIAMCDRLRAAGFVTDFASTVGEAIAMAASSIYAAILVDLALPEGDGISLIQRLRAQPQYLTTPIIVISTDPDRERNDLRSSTLNVLDWLDRPVDIDRLLQVLDRSVIRNVDKRSQVLHVDDDPDVLHIVAQALNACAAVVSVESVERAREALAAHRFDLVLLDLAIAAGSGLDLLPELHDPDGDAIPVIVFSGKDANPALAERMQTALTKSRVSIDSLVATLRKRVAANTANAPKAKDVA